MKRRQRISFIVVAVVAAAIGIVSYSTDVFNGLELDSVDARFGLRGTQPVPDDVVVVVVDVKTFGDLDEQWPFPRSMHGKVIDRVTEAGARAIAYDVQFTEPTEPAEDDALISAVERARNVVLATTEVDRKGESNIFGGDDVLESIGARPGNAQLTSDRDGTVRRADFQTLKMESFSVAAAEVATGEQVDPKDFDSGSAWIDYAGPGRTLRTVSFSDVLKGRVDPELFRDRIVVVGSSAPSLQDLHTTSAGGGLMAGPELQANAIVSILEGLPLAPTPPALEILLIIVLAAAGPLAGSFLRPPFAFSVALGLAVLYLAGAQVAFNSGLIMPVVDPLLALLLGTVGMLGLYYLFASFERQRVRFTFSRFVPENVVNQVLADGEGGLQLGGARIDCTLMFTDVRGFTTYSESRPPTEVVEVLNRYLGEMTNAIMDNGGTLVAYMGDGIMAVFGAPVEQEDHADRAIAASREILEERLPAFCDWMEETGRGEGFKMGIGLNTGEVLSGQVGSERRMEYTTIGDTTNTAARLEGMTKGSGRSLFISDSTKEARVDPAEDLELVGDLEVRGRDATIRVWSITGLP